MVRSDNDAPPIWRSALWIGLEWTGALVLAMVLFVVIGRLRAPDLPDQAPDFTLQSLDGRTFTLSELHGKTVVLDFWAPWCGPCRFEIPWFAEFAQAHPEVVVLGLAVDGTPAELGAAVKQLGITYPVLRADAATERAYGVTTLPTTVIVGPDGAVKSVHTGIMTKPELAWATR